MSKCPATGEEDICACPGDGCRGDDPTSYEREWKECIERRNELAELLKEEKQKNVKLQDQLHRLEEEYDRLKEDR
jgi:hypothetical protein